MQESLQTPIFSISEVSQKIKRSLETEFGSIKVKGELSGFKRHTSGHGYFALKDADAVLDGVCWKGQLSKFQFTPQDGMEVVCTGKITSYPGRSKYQIVVSHMEISGEGTLLKVLEERKRKLYHEGLFAPERKKKIPYLPKRIGVITSATGAVIRDIVHRLQDRFPVHVLLWPVLVQGKGAEDQITAAIQGFNQLDDDAKPDLLIVARGGGSLEDLWCFNEENVVRATAESSIPIIAAVGHETDITLIDYAADRRAPTPTAAAEMAVPVREDLKGFLLDRWSRLYQSTEGLLSLFQERLTHLERSLPNLEQMVEERTQRLDDWGDRLQFALMTSLNKQTGDLSMLGARLKRPEDLITQEELKLAHLGDRLKRSALQSLESFEGIFNAQALLLESYSYTATLKRGFSIIKDKDGNALIKKADLKKGENIQVVLQDGARLAEVID